MLTENFTRRTFLQLTGLSAVPLAFPKLVPNFEFRIQNKLKSLIIIQLAGANDGYNTLIPILDSRRVRNYRSARPTLAIPREQFTPLAESYSYALHPSLQYLAKMIEQKSAVILDRVEARASSLSHFERTLAWMNDRTNHCERNADTSIPGRILRKLKPAKAQALCFEPELFHAGALCDYGILADLDFVRHEAALGPPGDMKLFENGGDLALQLRCALTRLATAVPPRIVLAALPGFDTHANQKSVHASRLSCLDSALGWFVGALKAAGMTEQVCILIFSEMGRSLRENDQGGTGHASAGPVFIIAPNLIGGVITAGKRPCDHSALFANIARDWFKLEQFDVPSAKYSAPKLFAI